MAGKIIIDTERCKGCGLCVSVCPKKNLVICAKSNKAGFFPVLCTGEDCSGCAACAVICPEAAIEVYRDQNVIAAKTDKKKKSNLIKEKA